MRRYHEDEEEEEEEEDEDFDDEDEEVCPHGCDQTLYDKVGWCRLPLSNPS